MRQSLGAALRPGGLALTRRALDLSLLFGLRPGARVLDVGCGQGATLAFLGEEGFAAMGLDPSPVLLTEAGPRGPVLAGRAEALPFADQAFGAVFCECVLSLCADRQAALAEFYRVLALNGLLVLCDLYRKAPCPDAASPPKSPGRRTSGGCLDGAEPLQALLARLDRTGFSRRHFENRDKDLKELAARLIFAHGSLEAFWSAVAGTGSNSPPGAAPGAPPVANANPNANPNANLYGFARASAEALPGKACDASACGPDCPGPGPNAGPGPGAWPGYFLLIAQKDETP